MLFESLRFALLGLGPDGFYPPGESSDFSTVVSDVGLVSLCFCVVACGVLLVVWVEDELRIGMSSHELLRLTERKFFAHSLSKGSELC